MEGWLKIYRKFTQWEWYQRSEMVHLFLHLLISANHKPRKWQGVQINTGQLITGRLKLAAETGLSERQIRTCLTNLKKSGEIFIKTTNRYSVITICNYDTYQSKEEVSDQQSDQQTTSKRPADDQQSTTNKNEKNLNNEKEFDKPSHSEKIDFEILKNVYHEKCPKLNKITKLTADRKKAVRARIKEHGKSAVMQVFSNVGNSPFLNGHNDKNWLADFDWIFRPTNFLKILEGNYSKSIKISQTENAAYAILNRIKQTQTGSKFYNSDVEVYDNQI